MTHPTPDTVTTLITDAESEALWFRDILLLIRASGEHTGGRFAILEALSPRGSATPRHTQPQDEVFTILEGEQDHYIDEQVVHAGPGDTVYIPRGTTHAFRVTSEISRHITALSPAGHERFFQILGRPAEQPTLPPSPTPLDLAAFKAAAQEAGFEILGPPPPAMQ